MILDLVTAPAVEPLTVEEAKDHCRVSSGDEDALIARLIEAARMQAEEFTRRAFVTQTWDLRLPAFPASSRWELPKAPLQSVTYVQYVDDTGSTQTWSSSSYDVSVAAGPYALPGRIALAYGESYPSTRYQMDAVTVRFIAGYGLAAAVPAGIKQAILMLVGEMYERREEVTLGVSSTPNAIGAERLLWPFRLLDG